MTTTRQATRAYALRPRPRSGNVRDSQWTDRLVSFATPVGLLVVWEIAAGVGLVDTRFFPPPSAIVGAFVDLLGSGELLANSSVSLRRLFLGFLVGAVPALGLGLALGLYRKLRVAVDPLIAATYPIPKSAIFPMFLLIFGLGEASKIAMVAVGVFFPIVINTAAGVRQIDSIYHDVGMNFGAGRWQTFRTIALPGAMPLIFTGIQLAAGMALMLIVVAEMLGGRDGLGFMIWNSWQTFSVETMYAGLIVISAIGLLLTLALVELERVVVPWRRGR